MTDPQRERADAAGRCGPPSERVDPDLDGLDVDRDRGGPGRQAEDLQGQRAPRTELGLGRADPGPGPGCATPGSGSYR